MTYSPRRRITTRLFTCAALLMLAAGPSGAYAQEETPTKELRECPRGWKLETAEFDVFAPHDERGLKTFGALDLSTAVITNTGASPARVTITYFYEDCLCKPEASQVVNQCEVLETQIAEVHPGDQTVSILNFSPSFFGNDRRRIAYRVLVQSMSHYGDLFDEDSAQQDPDANNGVNYQLMELYVDFYRNLKMVDCRRIDGIPDFSDEERRRANIQSIRVSNYVIPLASGDNSPPDPAKSSGFQIIRPTDRKTEDDCVLTPPAEADEIGGLNPRRSRIDDLSPVKISSPRPSPEPNSREIMDGGGVSGSLQGDGGFNH